MTDSHTSVVRCEDCGAQRETTGGSNLDRLQAAADAVGPDAAVIACQLASARRYMEGEERDCAGCGARVFVSFDTLEAFGPANAVLACLGCALPAARGEPIYLSPFAHDLATRAGLGNAFTRLEQ